jgi:hypothetical protein
LLRRPGEEFPDGQLHAELVAGDGTVIELPEIAGGFLRALGVPPDAVPVRSDERTALLRSVLAGKRVLIVLDGAPDGANIEELVPAAPGCALLVAGSSTLASQGAQVLLDVRPLMPADAYRLLARLAGKDDGETAEEIVEAPDRREPTGSPRRGASRRPA